MWGATGDFTPPKLFNLYMNDLVVKLSSTHVGFYTGDTYLKSISYADDMVLLSSFIGALRKLVNKCEVSKLHGLQLYQERCVVFKVI